jgi:uncharacterized membrane protein YphA (DoxX/SURF4 family)
LRSRPVVKLIFQANLKPENPVPDLSILHILQLVVGLGLLNVWLLRARSATAYRGGDAGNLREEFRAYGLPDIAFYIVGALKVGAGIILLTGLWIPMPVTAAAGIVAVLMVGALVMHAKVGDPLKRSVPAALMLLMCAGIIYLG